MLYHLSHNKQREECDGWWLPRCRSSVVKAKYAFNRDNLWMDKTSSYSATFQSQGTLFGRTVLSTGDKQHTNIHRVNSGDNLWPHTTHPQGPSLVSQIQRFRAATNQYCYSMDYQSWCNHNVTKLSLGTSTALISLGTRPHARVWFRVSTTNALAHMTMCWYMYRSRVKLQHKINISLQPV